MIVFDEAKLFNEPLKIKKVLSEDRAEMSGLQQSMLCGLIKEYKPKKILEVGVSAGGTTAVILNCISQMEIHTAVYSVDILENYYKDKSKKTGYLAEECKPFLDKKVSHTIYRGGYLPEHLDDIGGDIDFLILDTVHILPGEIFDFLSVLPWLKDDAVVVLHDIFLNHYESSKSINSYATRVLLSAVVGDKIIGHGNDGYCNYIGLGAFKVTPDTKKYIENLFSALMITWRYMPDLKQIQIYREWFSKIYSDDLLEEFDAAVELNRVTLLRKKNDNDKVKVSGLSSILRLLKWIENKENIYIYGCGTYGKEMCNLLESLGIEVKGFVVSDNQVKPHVNKVVDYISDMDVNKCTLILAMSISNQKEISNKGSMPENWICIDENIINFLKI